MKKKVIISIILSIIILLCVILLFNLSGKKTSMLNAPVVFNSNKCLVSDGDEILVSQHAGYTDDEVYIPLIKVLKK